MIHCVFCRRGSSEPRRLFFSDWFETGAQLLGSAPIQLLVPRMLFGDSPIVIVPSAKRTSTVMGCEALHFAEHALGKELEQTRASELTTVEVATVAL